MKTKYREVKVSCFGSAESGPCAILEDGRRVYGVAGAAPLLLSALEALLEQADLGEVDDETRPIVEQAREAIRKATS